ncbi:Legume-like lectin family protein [Trichomonas vaginalis G3]|uniref:Legume-like lectin family protein n=1 Tax=Trichomonas vaginalis (strain ATCC PRA-98 / G3) TaxID=412133 RepID=A2FUT8_TRIV3|nr:lectin, mannose-binding, 1 family [Trichomonas vaginalis G3]EAX91327.1 Legume-like lectin family protein [Trichomonas vaginalis G3]KAI5547563.1 lectin, mannose-binding, 1 family [Trichomonas vaginalis G3]|eukprot:XP_001304257.1 Legume-like lectin family protein [Trichomonas vaginalis G3]
MFSLFFLHLKGFEQSADLIPPFYPNSNNQIGYWNIGGAAIIEEGKIILAPPIQYRKGSAWSSLPLPYGDWQITFDLKISQGNGGGGFAIPIITTHSSDGPFYGISDKFSGIVLVGAVFADNEGNPTVHYNIYQSDGSKTFKVMQDIDPCLKSIPLDNENFKVTLSIFNKTINATHTDSKGQKTLITDAPITIDISKCWIGISAMCDDYTSKIEMFNATFNTDDMISNRRKQAWTFQGMPYSTSSTVQPEKIEKLRNPSFFIMRNELKTYETTKGDLKAANKTIEDYLKITSEFAEVIDEVATYGQLNDFITNTLVPYTDSWHQRTFKIMDAVAKANKIMSASLNETQALFYSFNQTVNLSLTKARTKISSIKDILIEESEVQLLDQIMTVKKSVSPIVNYLIYISTAEVIGLLVFGFIQCTPWFKHRYM